MKNLITYLIQKPATVSVLTLLILVLGLLSLSNLRTNFLPPEPVNFISISAVYRGASPIEVEEEVVSKIEEKLEGLKGIERVTSTSSESFAQVRVEVTEHADRNEVLLDVNNAVKSITTFPRGLDVPVIVKEEVLNYTMTLAVQGSGSLNDLKDYAKAIKDELLLNPSLSQIYLSGYPDEEIEIQLREQDLRAYQLSPDEVALALGGTNLKASGGEVETGQQRILIRMDSRSYYAKDLLSTVIKATPEGKVISLGDVATVTDRFANSPQRSFLNGKPAVFLRVFSRGEEDILNNTSLLNSYAETFNAENSLFSLVVVEDKGISLSDAISSLQNNAWQGMLLVLIVLGLFLDPRIAFWVAFKIPVALLGMFTLGYLYDLTINQVSLFGTIIVLGVIVDDGVVVAENIYDKYLKGKSPLHAALEGVLEVVPSVISSLITTALAFSIFFFFDGQLGDYFSDVSFVVCTTLCIALLESLLFLPVHIARSKALGAGYKPWKITEVTNASLIRFRDRYFTRIITFSLNRPVWPIVIVFVGMGLTIAALGSGTIKSTFFPTIDQDMITAELELEPGTDERILLEKLDRIESAVWEVNDEFSSLREDSLSVVTFVEKVLTPNSNEGYLSIYLLESDKRDLLSYEISARIREKVGPMPEARNVAFKSLNAFGKPVSIALISPDAEELAQAKVLLRAALEKRSDLKDITDTDKQGTPEVLLTLKERSRLLGLNEAQIFDQVRKGFFGLEAQSLQRGDEEVKIWIRYDAKDRASLYQLASMRITGPDGSSYPLEELVDFTTQWSTTQIHHQSGVREIRVEADVANLMVSVPAVLAEAEAGVLAEIQDRFPSIRYTLEGEARLSSKTQASSQGPSILVLILILVILMLNYRSVGKTFAIMAMLPFAFIGVAWGTFIHQIPVSIFSFLGLIALWGILINNGLVLVSTFNDNLQAGLRIKEAMADAVISRFRPIVLTTITTVFGLAPLLLSNSISSQFIQPTAIAIAYGLIFGLVLSLTFLPAVLLLLSKVKTILARRWSRNPTIQPEELDVVLKEAKNQLL